MAVRSRSPLLGLVTLIVGLAAPASHHARAAGDRQPVLTARDSDGVEGLASYYSKRFNGRRTTSGEKHRPEALTAAHPDLPLGTRVRVVHLANRRETIVRINDRCRRRKTPVIDLSRAAAQEIGIVRQGRARVRIIPLGPEGVSEP